MTRTPIPMAHTWLVRVLFGILILYSACMLWPAYHSGLAFFPGDPKWEWHQPYDIWYLREGTLDPSPLDWLILELALLSTPAALAAIPLGAITCLSTGVLWSQLSVRSRWWSLSISMLAILVPILTWTATSQFLRWLTD